jgi:glutaminase
MLRNFGILTSDPMPAVELYFQQCSVSVTARDLGVMAATLANRGVNPVTGKQAIRGAYVESILSVMGSCGMYDFAGEWSYNIGMPAKKAKLGARGQGLFRSLDDNDLALEWCENRFVEH